MHKEKISFDSSKRLLAESIFLQFNTNREITPLYDNELTNVLFVTTLS